MFTIDKDEFQRRRPPRAAVNRKLYKILTMIKIIIVIMTMTKIGTINLTRNWFEYMLHRCVETLPNARDSTRFNLLETHLGDNSILCIAYICSRTGTSHSFPFPTFCYVNTFSNLDYCKDRHTVMIRPSWRMHHRTLGPQKPQLLSPNNATMANRFSSLYLCRDEVPTLCIGSHVILHCM
jgi:hypothetical protein